MSHRVVIVQPYIPQYRVPFFAGLTRTLADRGIHVTVAAGEPVAGQAARHDAAELPGLVRLDERRFGRGTRSLLVRRLGDVVDGADLIVMEQARRNLEAYPLLLRRGVAPVALWGHGRTSTRTVRPWEHHLLDGLTRRADWFFAYTEGGSRYMVEHGFPADRISVVQNATDARSLAMERRAVTAASRRSLMHELGLTDGRTALFMGALDNSKRIGFLLSAAEALATALPGFTLVVAGDGPWRGSVQAAAESEPWLRCLGPVFGSDRARLAAATDLMLNPGRVGLNVVDSFALGLPMITTDWPGHAPEIEYLHDGVNGIVTRDSLSEFVAAAVTLFTDPGRLDTLRRGCAESAKSCTIEGMVDRFAGGVQSALAAGSRGGLGGRWPSQLTSAGSTT